VKVTLILQLAPAATLDPHVLVCAKSLAFVPVTAMLVMVRVALPLLVRVTAWAVLVVPTAWLENARLPVDRVTAGAGELVPVPDKPTACGLPLALSVTLSEALRLPVAEGVKVTLIVQLAPAATELPHALV
jgi:hypothetical protein